MTDIWTQLSRRRVERLAQEWQGKPILVIGDVMLDRYLWGNVTRISPEAPVPVVEVERESFRLGGAANVAQNVRSLGGRPRLVGVVGGDDSARVLRERLAGLQIGDDGLVTEETRPTSLKTRIVARGQHVVRADQEHRGELTEAAAGRVLEAALVALADAAAVVVSDYGKGVVNRTLLGALLAEAKRRSVPVCVDPKEAHFFSYREVAVLTPNQHEAAFVLGYKLEDDEAVSRAGKEILERVEADSVLITRGEQGMSLFERSGRRTDFPAVARRVYDVTGAGDTVVSAYAAALAGKAEPREAAMIANHAAGLVVAEVGTAAPDMDSLLASFPGEPA